jgi:VanZ family protein
LSEETTINPFRPWRGPLTASPAERTLRLFPAAVWLVVIFVASSIPGTDLPSGIDDRVAHTAVYFILGMLVMLAVAGFARPEISGRHYLFAFLFCVAYGISDEIHQMFVPNRTPSLKDVFFDALGTALALMVVRLGVGAGARR